ncbi:MAG TPA: hypothetical protein VD969_11040 [Symbiobacteriaceae bacterium]|nr:hypothetical protein [Symbiobacteriaceae bacterium]
MYSVTGIIVGVLVGLIVTVVVTLLWPRNFARFARPIVSAGLGFGVAYLLMRMIK